MSPQGPRLLHRGAFSAAHGPSSLCVDLVNYLGCQGPTTAYPRRGRWGARGAQCGGEKKKEWEREWERNHCRGPESKNQTVKASGRSQEALRTEE